MSNVNYADKMVNIGLTLAALIGIGSIFYLIIFSLYQAFIS